MAMATTLQDYLEEMDAVYDIVGHPRHMTSVGIAILAHVPAACLAKGVLVRDAAGRLSLTVVPSDQHVDLRRLDGKSPTGVEMASEEEIVKVFNDCDPGAVPPMGNAYGIKVLLDNNFANLDEVYFEAGDHEALVHVTGDEFRRLMGGAERGDYVREPGALDG